MKTPKMYVTTIYHFLSTNTCLGPSTRIAKIYSAFLHFRHIHKLGHDGELRRAAICEHSHRETFCGTTPRVEFNTEVLNAVLLRLAAERYSFQRSGELQVALSGWLWPSVYVPVLLSYLIDILIDSADCLLHCNMSTTCPPREIRFELGFSKHTSIRNHTFGIQSTGLTVWYTSAWARGCVRIIGDFLQ